MTEIKMTNKIINILLLISLAVYTALIILMSSVPPVSRDALTHHLIIPKLYVEHGGIYEIPSIVFSYYPQLIDLLYTIPLWLGNDIVPKYIHFLFALLTAIIIYLFIRRKLGSVWGLMGALFFLSIPVIVKLSVTVYIDLGLIFFSTAALFSLILWLENTAKLKWFIISAISCGLALSCKYNGLITLVLLTMAVPFFYLRTQPRHQLKAIGFGGLFFIIALMVFSPWMVKNYIWTQNPLYPLYHSFFVTNPASEQTASETAQQVAKEKPMGRFLRRKLIYGETSWEIFSTPLRIFFIGKDDDPKYFDGRLNPFLLFLPLLIPLLKSRNKQPVDRPYQANANLLLASFSILLILLVFLKSDTRIRYLAPAIPALIVLSIQGLYCLRQRLDDYHLKHSIQGLIVASVFIIALSFNISYITSLYQKIDPVSYLSGQVNRDQYIEKYRLDYAAIQYANNNLPADAKILVVYFGNRRYYFNRPSDFNYAQLHDAIKQADSAEDIAERLVKNHFTHLMIRYELMNNWIRDNADDREKILIQTFLNHYTQPLFSKSGYGVFRLINS